MTFDTVCVHSDTPNAVDVATAIKKILDPTNSSSGKASHV